MKALVILVALAACGDNELPNAAALAPARDLAIVAHEDDDLLFMQPDLVEAVRDRTGVTIVYVTAGNDDRDLDYATKRYTGVMAAYSTLAAGAWQCGWTELAGHAAEHCRLDAANLSLVFLGYPDGGKQGEFPSSLLALAEGRITGADTIADRSAHYDLAGLIATLAEVISLTEPTTIHTLEVAGTHGLDHSDHMMVGALAVLASAGGDRDLLSYRGYDIADEPVDDFAPITELADNAFAHYSACTDGCAACGDACPAFSPTYAGYLQRHYAVRIGRRARGALVMDGACANVANGTVVMTSCDAAPAWRVDTMLHVGDRCATVEPTGELVTTGCDAATPVALDEEGHLWIASPPATVTDLAHLDCIAVIDGQPRITPCGGDYAPAWTVLAPTVTTAGFPQPAQLADVTGDGIADLCAIEATNLWCAAGDGSGGFAAATKIAELAIDPASLVFGDLDGDGAIDACGRDTTGVVCATAASGWLAARVGPALSDLAIVGGELCGVGADGVLCGTDVLSSWPSPGATVWLADLDGDGKADWCAATPTGPACGRAADRALSSAGVPWAFSLGGVVDASSGVATLGDLDGDGRADLCAIDGSTVTCAFGHATGFGPRTEVMQLAETPIALSVAAHALCVDTGSGVTCSSP